MGNCCKPVASSSMEWGGEDWESLRSSSNQTTKPTKKPYRPSSSSSSSRTSKVFDESAYHILDHDGDQKNNSSNIDILGKLRDSCDANGKVTLKISKCELAELLEAIQHNNNNNNNNNNNQQPKKQMKKKKKKKEVASAEQVLFRLMKARDHQIIPTHWKPMLDTIPE